MLKNLERKQLVFDAVYMRVRPDKHMPSMTCYSQIYKDFGISPDNVPANVLVIRYASLPLRYSSVSLENDDVRDREGEELLFDASLPAASREVFW